MVLEMRALGFAYDPAVPVFAGWSWSAPPGVVQLLGGDGAGKTTALQLLAGVLAPTAGEIRGVAAERFWFDLRDPQALGSRERPVAQWADGVLAQHHRADRAALQAQLQDWGLAEHWHKPLLALSTGTLRKAVMAVAMASGAPLVLLDEPLSGLDKPSIRHLQQVLAEAAPLVQARGQHWVLAHYEPLLDGGAAVHTVHLPS
ncbi:MAG: ABC transporter ATP-binding protein [Comamonas sp.]